MSDSQSRRSIRVLIADDHQLVRRVVRSLLEAGGVQVVGEAADGTSAISLAARLRPDVVLMDVQMPGLDGVEATRRICASADNGGCPRVIAFSGYCNERFTREMLCAGASGFILKTSSIEELLTALRVVMQDRRYISLEVEKSPVGKMLSRGSSAMQVGLSPREQEVLTLLAEGKAMKEVAKTLHLSVKTVETHRRSLMQKLNLYTVAELTKYAVRRGLTALNV